MQCILCMWLNSGIFAGKCIEKNLYTTHLAERTNMTSVRNANYYHVHGSNMNIKTQNTQSSLWQMKKKPQQWKRLNRINELWPCWGSKTPSQFKHEQASQPASKRERIVRVLQVKTTMNEENNIELIKIKF